MYSTAAAALNGIEDNEQDRLVLHATFDGAPGSEPRTRMAYRIIKHPCSPLSLKGLVNEMFVEVCSNP